MKEKKYISARGLLVGGVVLLSVVYQMPANGQGSVGRQLQLTVDNDAYFFSSYDRYYTSGIFASFSQLTDRLRIIPVIGGSREDGKYSYDMWFSHYIYTAKDIRWNNVDQLDRPYAGMLTLGAQTNAFFASSAFTLRADVGWLGPSIRTDDLMRFWHETLNIRRPNGWDYQINNTPVFSLQPQYFKRWSLGGKSDIVTTSGIFAGTVFNRFYQEVSWRIGKPGLLNASHFTNSLLRSGQVSEGKAIEWYFFASLQGSAVLYDATIDGNFIGPKSKFTGVSEPWVLRHTYGVVVAGDRTDIELSFKITSQEVKGAEMHRYMRAKLSRRF